MGQHVSTRKGGNGALDPAGSDAAAHLAPKQQHCVPDQSTAAPGVLTLGLGQLDACRVPFSQVPGLYVLASSQVAPGAGSARSANKQCTCGPAVEAGDGSVLSEALQVGCISSATPGASGGLQVVWDVDIQTVFGMQDTSRSPCGSNTRLVSPSFTWQPGETQGCDSPTHSETHQVANHMKQLSMVPAGRHGTHWRLMWAMFDHSDSHVSLYLTRSSPHQQLRQLNGEPASSDISSNTSNSSSSNISSSNTSNDGSHFAAHAAAPAAANGGHAAAADAVPQGGAEEGALPVTWRVAVQGITTTGHVSSLLTAEVPAHDYQHTSCWGLQRFLTLQELDALTTASKLRVCATLSCGPQKAVNHQGHTYTSGATTVPAFTGNDTTTSTLGSAKAPRGEQGASPPRMPSTKGARTTTGQPGGIAPIVLVSLSPRILMIDGFLEPELCDALVALATPRLVRSRVSTGMETPSRTSRGTFFTGPSAQDPLILTIEERIAKLITHPAAMGGKKPLTNSEALQVVAYSSGDFYTEHYDNKAGGYVTRHATIIIYLCDCEDGGGTLFPRASAAPSEQDLAVGQVTGPQVAQLSQQLNDGADTPRPGVRIMPVKGRAILFWSALPDGTEDLASLHAAEVVGHGSEKWIATRWFKEV